MKVINKLPDNHNSEMHDLLKISNDIDNGVETIIYANIYKKDILMKDLPLEVINDVINQLADRIGQPIGYLKICCNNLMKMPEELFEKVLNKNWNIYQGR